MLKVNSDFELKDVKSFNLRGVTLKSKAVGTCFKSPKFKVSGSGGLKWWIRVFPNGCSKAVKGYVSVFIYVNRPVKSKCMCIIDGRSVQKSSTHAHGNRPLRFGWADCVSHKSLGPVSNKRKLTFTCIVEFDIAKQHDASAPHVFQLLQHESPEFDLVVDSNRLPVHKHFLSLISPVFKAMLFYDTAKSKSNQVEITDFSYDTVKTAIEFCYGRDLIDLSLDTAIDILRFCYKYNINAAIEEIEKLPLFALTTENFCKIVSYAYDCNKMDLLDKCCCFFNEHQNEIKAKPEFVDLSPFLVYDVLKTAFDLETEFDVLQYAYQSGISGVVHLLEDCLVESMSVDNFCIAVDYAWKCSRDSLKKACAKYLNDNREEVTDSEDFLNLPAEVVLSILQVAHKTKREIV